jgi:CHAT domain-containing protein/Tfp pilus assembly protein PilF
MKYLIILLLCSLKVQGNYGQIQVPFKFSGFENKADSLFGIFQYDSSSVYYSKTASICEHRRDWLACVQNYRLTSNVLLKAGKSDTALYYAVKALDFAEVHFQKNNKKEMFEKSRVFLNLASVKEAKEKYEEALTFCYKALEDGICLGDSKQMANVLNVKGIVLSKLGSTDSALLNIQKALNIRLTHQHNEQAIGESYSCIGQVYERSRKYNEALEYYQKALKIRIVVLGDMHPDVADCNYLIGRLFWRKGEYDKALYYQKIALSIRIKCFGEKHPEVAKSYQSLGLNFRKKGEYDNALIYHQKALNIRIAIYGAMHPEVANSYNNMATVQVDKGEYDKALEYNLKALNIYISAKASDTYLANSYNNIGSIYFNKAEYDKALEYFQLTLKMYINILGETCAEVALINNNIGMSYSEKGEYSAALEYFQKALKIRADMFGEMHPDIASSYNNIGLLYNKKGEYDTALGFHLKALRINITALGEIHPDVALGYSNIGLLYYKKGEYDKALTFHLNALKIGVAVLGEKDSEVANTYNNIGNIYDEEGEYDKALKFYLKGLEIRIAVLGGRHPDVANSFNNIGSIYDKKGEYDKTLDYYQKALQTRISFFGEMHPDVAESYYNIGNLNYHQGKYDKALEFYLKALNIYIKIFDRMHPNIALIYNNMGIIYGAKGENAKAIEYNVEALQIQISAFGEHHPNVATSYNIIGTLYEKNGDFNKALGFYQKALQANLPDFKDTSIYVNPKLVNILSKPVLSASLTRKADALYHLYLNQTNRSFDREISLATYDLAFQLINNMRNEYRNESTKLLLGKNNKGGYITATFEAIEYDKANISQNNAIAFDFMEKGKSATLSAQLNDIEARHFSGIPDTLLNQEKTMEIKMNHYVTEMNKIKSKKGGYDTIRINSIENQYFKISCQYDSLISYFETTFPEYYALKYSNKTATIKEIQSALGNKSALINYFVGDTAIFIAVVTDSVYKIIHVKIDSTFEESVINYYRSIKKADIKKFMAFNHLLYKKLMLPIMPYITQKENFVIIPDDYLWYIPFETLVEDSKYNEDFRTMNYLVKNHSINYHYTASLWLNNIKSPVTYKQNVSNYFIGFAPVFDKPGHGYLLKSSLGIKDTSENSLTYRTIYNDSKSFNPLPYSEIELSSIVKSFEKNKKNAIGFFNEEASKDNFKTNVKYAKYIHLATHGFTNDKNPGLSGLAFAQPKLDKIKNDSIDDGIIYSGEIYNLDLQAQLVVLSACETGIGKMIKGEGMLGLSRGFLYAGASNIVYSLWSVPDKSTNDLMIEFYNNVLKGENFAIALKNAKLNLIRNPDTSFPKHWAGFLLLGK